MIIIPSKNIYKIENKYLDNEIKSTTANLKNYSVKFANTDIGSKVDSKEYESYADGGNIAKTTVFVVSANEGGTATERAESYYIYIKKIFDLTADNNYININSASIKLNGEKYSGTLNFPAISPNDTNNILYQIWNDDENPFPESIEGTDYGYEIENTESFSQDSLDLPIIAGTPMQEPKTEPPYNYPQTGTTTYPYVRPVYYPLTFTSYLNATKPYVKLEGYVLAKTAKYRVTSPLSNKGIVEIFETKNATITFYGERLEEIESILVNEPTIQSTKNFSMPQNTLVQNESTVKTLEIEILRLHKNNSQNIVLVCSIGNYYDENGNPVIGTRPNARDYLAMITFKAMQPLQNKFLITFEGSLTNTTYGIKYKDEFANISSDLSYYYILVDENSEFYKDYQPNTQIIVTALEHKLKRLFEVGDEVIPYIYTAYRKDVPLSVDKAGNAKVFTVVGEKAYYDGAVWQQLTLQEKK